MLVQPKIRLYSDKYLRLVFNYFSGNITLPFSYARNIDFPP